MKCKWLLLSLFVLLAPGPVAHAAGGSESHGGTAVYITNEDGSGGWFFLDLIEDDNAGERILQKLRDFRKAAIENGKARMVIPSQEKGYTEIFLPLTVELDAVLPGLAKPMRDHFGQIEWLFINGEDLPELSDTGLLEKDYLKKQLAIQFDDTVLINEEIFRALGKKRLPSGQVLDQPELTVRFQGGLFTHEDLIHIVKKKSKTLVNIPLIRKAVRFLMNRKYKDDKEAQDFFHVNFGIYFDTRAEADNKEEFEKLTKLVEAAVAPFANREESSHYCRFVMWQVVFNADFGAFKYGVAPRTRESVWEHLRQSNCSVAGMAHAVQASEKVDPHVLEVRERYRPAIRAAIAELADISDEEVLKAPDEDLLPRGVFVFSIADELKRQFEKIGNPDNLDLDSGRMREAIREASGRAPLLFRLLPQKYVLDIIMIGFKRVNDLTYSEWNFTYALELLLAPAPESESAPKSVTKAKK